MRKTFVYLAALTLMTGTFGLAAPKAAMAAPEGEQIVEELIVDEQVNENEDEDEVLEDDDVIMAELESEGPAVVAEARVAAQEAAEAAANSKEAKRQAIVDYAMQFVGGKYRAGGNDPNTGADCSGFVRYVMQNGAGITMNRSASTQASQGVQVSSDQMQPGDLLFYSNGSRINHVAMYIGDGQIVHASTYATGIKVSPWNYRAPVKIINVLG